MSNKREKKPFLRTRNVEQLNVVRAGHKDALQKQKKKKKERKGKKKRIIKK